jgi:predicted nucleic acid-binding protein
MTGMTGKLLDTTVLIDLSRGNVDAADFIDAAFTSGTPLFISVISAMELVTGCRDQVEVEKVKMITDLTANRPY